MKLTIILLGLIIFGLFQMIHFLRLKIKREQRRTKIMQINSKQWADSFIRAQHELEDLKKELG